MQYRNVEKRINFITVEGNYGDITFCVTGPSELVNSIINFIRNLTRMISGGNET